MTDKPMSRVDEIMSVLDQGSVSFSTLRAMTGIPKDELISDMKELVSSNQIKTIVGAYGSLYTSYKRTG